MRVLLLILLLAAASPCGAAVFPTLNAGTYAGEVSEGQRILSVALRLVADQRFVLEETTRIENKPPQRQNLTGHWHQLESGSVLQLSNRNGYLRVLNVGGMGNLYLGVQAPFSRYQNITLKPKPLAPAPYALSGVLRLVPLGATLTDTATGVPLPVVQNAALEHLWARHKDVLFLEADVHETAEGLELERVISASETLPHLWKETPIIFQQTVKDTQWRMAEGELVSFLPTGSHTGTLVLERESGRLTVPYTLSDDGIRFAGEDKKQPLADKALRLWLSRTRAWAIHGDALLFSASGETLSVLEKIR